MSDHLERVKAMLGRLDKFDRSTAAEHCPHTDSPNYLGEILLVSVDCDYGHGIPVGAGDATGEDLRGLVAEVEQLRAQLCAVTTDEARGGASGIATIRDWVTGARYGEELIELEAQTLRAALAEHDSAHAELEELRKQQSTAEDTVAYRRWLHRQLRAAYRAGHADAREEIRHAIVGTGRDLEGQVARYVTAWDADTAGQQTEPEPCDGDCDCDCQPGQPCLCPERDCYCGPCRVCRENPQQTEQPDTNAGFLHLANRTHLNYVPTDDEQPEEEDSALHPRQTKLLAAIRYEGGDFTPSMASYALSRAGIEVTPSRAAQIMKTLADRGYLEPVRPRAFTYRLLEQQPEHGADAAGAR